MNLFIEWFNDIAARWGDCDFQVSSYFSVQNQA